ncbi:unnamed protein product [Lathyrus sativus]|nr:unnamed protein product [Lathyrus sativus]
MKFKAVKENWRWKTKKFGLRSVFLLCIFFFLAGFSGSRFFHHSVALDSLVLEKSTEEEVEHRVLHGGESGDDFITSIPFQILSWSPRLLYFPNFASAKQCEIIVEIAKVGLTPSQVLLHEGQTEENTQEIRTSSGVFINATQDKTGVLEVIEEKIARASKLPRTHGETFNILRYKIGQKYDSHYDAFTASEYGPVDYQRAASFLLYLTDVQEGGETVFPFENGLNMDGSYRYKDCIGLKIKPRKGDGILFYSLFPNGTIDPTSLHGSCPVIKGEKWVATKWIWNQILA